jgi:hypothetical protein
VEFQPVIELRLGQLLDPRDMLGCKIGPELDRHLAVLGREDQNIPAILRACRTTSAKGGC